MRLKISILILIVFLFPFGLFSQSDSQEVLIEKNNIKSLKGEAKLFVDKILSFFPDVDELPFDVSWEEKIRDAYGNYFSKNSKLNYLLIEKVYSFGSENNVYGKNREIRGDKIIVYDGSEGHLSIVARHKCYKEDWIESILGYMKNHPHEEINIGDEGYFYPSITSPVIIFKVDCYIFRIEFWGGAVELGELPLNKANESVNSRYFIRYDFPEIPYKYYESLNKQVVYNVAKMIEKKVKREVNENIITEDTIKFLNPYPSNGAKFSPEKTKSFRSIITYSLASEDRGIIEVKAIAIMEEGIQRTIGEKDIPVTKGQNKKMEVELPLNIPEEAEKVQFTAKMILEKEGDIGIYDEISAIPWIPASVELIMPDEPIVANGRGAYLFKVKVMQKGKPVDGAKIEVWPQASPYPFMTDAEIVGSSGVLHLTTNVSGIAEFYYKPPRVLPEKLPSLPGKKALTYPVLIKAPGFAKSKVWNISLYPPHPRIKSLRVSEVSAGDWQKAESIVEVEDPDSTFFTYTILFNGNIGWKGGHDNFKELVADGGKLFVFRLKPIKFGMDLQNLPSLYEKLWETNKQFIINEIFSLGALRLEKRGVFKNLVDKLKRTKLVLDVKGPAGDLKDAADLWGNMAEETGGKSLSMKNASDAIGVYIKGYNTTVGVVDYVDSWLDTGPYDPYSTALKLIYENAKTFYDVFEAHRKVAEAYEDVVFFPILVKVKDADGYRDIKIKKVAVRFWKR